MNNDVIEPSGRFARHPHDNAEIDTYITSGPLNIRIVWEMAQLLNPAIYNT